jgi:hypothetical protein
MRARLLLAFATALAVAVVSIAEISLAGQSAAAALSAPPSAAPRAPDGHPDFQGIYNVATLTPVERPESAGGKLTLTETEASSIERTERERVQQRALPSRADRAVPPVGGNVGGYNNFWIDRGSQAIVVDGQRRTSLIVDPSDGKIPAQTSEARQRNTSRPGAAARPTPDAAESDNTGGVGVYDDPELRPLGERCLLGFGSTSGPPTLPNYFYNNLKQIIQTPTSVMILVEMVHDARIIRMNSPHLPKTIRKWMGDSVGHWEGDTLVVDTTNFTNKTRFRGSSENLHVIERFTRTEANTLLYRFTVEDPSTWTRPWTGEYPWVGSNEMMYEYACHEGNYALGDILRGERLLEAEAAAKKRGSKQP